MNSCNEKQIKFELIKFYTFDRPPWTIKQHEEIYDTFEEAENVFMIFHENFYNCKCYDNPLYNDNKEIIIFLPIKIFQSGV